MSLQNLPGGAGSEPSAEAAPGREARHDALDLSTERRAPDGFRRLELGESILKGDFVWPLWVSSKGMKESIAAGCEVEDRDVGFYWRPTAGLPAPEPSLGEGSPSLEAKQRTHDAKFIDCPKCGNSIPRPLPAPTVPKGGDVDLEALREAFDREVIARLDSFHGAKVLYRATAQEALEAALSKLEGR